MDHQKDKRHHQKREEEGSKEGLQNEFIYSFHKFIRPLTLSDFPPCLSKVAEVRPCLQNRNNRLCRERWFGSIRSIPLSVRNKRRLLRRRAIRAGIRISPNDYSARSFVWLYALHFPKSMYKFFPDLFSRRRKTIAPVRPRFADKSIKSGGRRGFQNLI